MIVSMIGRWLDVREAHRARERAESGWSAVNIKYAVAATRAKLLAEQLKAKTDECVALSEAADGNTAKLHEQLTEALTKLRDVEQRLADTEKVSAARVDHAERRVALADKAVEALRIPAQAAEAVAARDRANAVRLSDLLAAEQLQVERLKLELAEADAWLDYWKREHR